MKNLKNMLTGIGMAAVLMVGATSAHAGLILSDRTAQQPSGCTVGTGILDEAAGIIIIGLMRDGLILSDRIIGNTGNASQGCNNGGISQRDGLILSD